MIQSPTDFTEMTAEIGENALFLHVIPADDKIHYSENKASVVFIKNIASGKTFYIPINHPDFSIPKNLLDLFLNYIRTIPNPKWVIDKKSTLQLLSCLNLKDVNLIGFFSNNKIIDLENYTTSAHLFVNRNWHSINNLNIIVPIIKHLELFENLYLDVSKLIKRVNEDESFENLNDIIIPTLARLEKNGIHVNRELYFKYFEREPKNLNDIVFTQYNLYTSTGRPSNRFDGINFAALNSKDDSRSAFTSRYGKDGKMVMMDYNAFFPRIICDLTKYNISKETDIYQYLAKLYFQIQEVSQEQIKQAKIITFRQLFGGIEEKYSHIRYFSSLKQYIDSLWDFFQTNKYIITPYFKRKITEHHIQEANPYKLFNYMLQAVEGEIAISKLRDVFLFLKNKKTMPVLYTYDSVLYDFYIPDGDDIIIKISEIMGYAGRFPLKIYEGDSYHSLQLKY